MFCFFLSFSAVSPQWLGTNTGFSQRSKGPSYDGNSFFFHNSNRRTFTRKRCRCGNGMAFQSAHMNGLTFSPPLHFATESQKHFSGSLVLHVRYASVYCVYRSSTKKKKGGRRKKRECVTKTEGVFGSGKNLGWKNVATVACKAASQLEVTVACNVFWGCPSVREKKKQQRVREPNEDTSYRINSA